MRPEPADRPREPRALAALLLLAALAAAGVGAFAAAAERVASPHGPIHLPCATCHDARGWTPAHLSPRFDHARFGFPLDGAHRTRCDACHASLRFADQTPRCAGCHEDPHRGEMGDACARCHSARSFLDRAPMVRAHQLTRLPLTGAHAALECDACHVPVAQGALQFVGTRTACVDCHLQDYRTARNPDHVAGGYPTTCEMCHTSFAWVPSRFDHDRTGFVLLGAHRAGSCESCHRNGVFRGTPRDCAGCHRRQYDATTNPPHAASGIPSTCEVCHGNDTWVPAVYNHDLTAFPLTGAHRGLACSACHGDGVYAGKSTACVSCHLTDYDNTTNPAHAAAGFPQTCASCHTTTSWLGATFDHDGPYFPIYSGTHAGRWTACTDCHTNPSSYASFDCLTCHPHDDKAQTDSNHGGISGYSYTSSACYSCHPKGTT